MWHIELVKNKYESLEDLYSLLQYVFMRHLEKTDTTLFQKINMN